MENNLFLFWTARYEKHGLFFLCVGIDTGFFVVFKSISPQWAASRYHQQLNRFVGTKKNKKTIQWEKIITQTKPVLGCSVSSFCLNLGCGFNYWSACQKQLAAHCPGVPFFFFFITAFCFISCPQSRGGLTADVSGGDTYWLVCLPSLSAWQRRCREDAAAAQASPLAPMRTRRAPTTCREAFTASAAGKRRYHSQHFCFLSSRHPAFCRKLVYIFLCFSSRHILVLHFCHFQF